VSYFIRVQLEDRYACLSLARSELKRRPRGIGGPMNSSPWVYPGRPAARPSRAEWAINLIYVLAGLGIAALAMIVTLQRVAEDQQDHAARLAFDERQTKATEGPRLFDWVGRDRVVDEAAGCIAVLVLAILVRRSRYASTRADKRAFREATARRSKVVEFIPPADRGRRRRAKSHRAAAERLAVVVWSDRVARNQAPPPWVSVDAPGSAREVIGHRAAG
jgi:hypothetical protein